MYTVNVSIESKKNKNKYSFAVFEYLKSALLRRARTAYP